MKTKTPFFSRTKSLPATDLDVIVKPVASEDSVIEMLDPAKLITYWRAEGWYPLAPTMTPEILGHDVPFDVDAERMHSLVRCIERGIALPAIDVGRSSGASDGLIFPDGRHRIVLFEAMGLTSIPAKIHKVEAEFVVGLVGANDLDRRVRVDFPLKSPRPRF